MSRCHLPTAVSSSGSLTAIPLMALQPRNVLPRLEDRNKRRVLILECWSANAAVFLNDSAVELF